MTTGPDLRVHNGLVITLARDIHAAMPRGVMLDDVAQEIRLFILEKGWRFNPQRGAFSTWLTACRPTLHDRCMRNLCGARKVRRGGRWTTNLIPAYWSGGMQRDRAHAPADALRAAELLSTLPERTGRVLACRMMDVGLQAIGDDLGLTTETVRRTERAGLTRLAALLGWDGDVGSFGLARGRGTWRLRDSGRRSGTA